MLDRYELNEMHILRDMPDRVLKEIEQIAELQESEGGTILFRQKEALTFFYIVRSGQVKLEVETSPDVYLPLGIIKPGYALGVSAFIPGVKSSATAKCIGHCKLLRFSGKRLQELFEQDPELGYYFLLKVAQMFKSRLNNRTMFFLKTLEKLPEIQSMFYELGQAETNSH